MLAKKMSKPASDHEKHQAYHYADAAVKEAVNFRKERRVKKERGRT